FDLLRIDDLGGQVVIYLGIGQVTLFLAAGNQKLELRLTVFSDGLSPALEAERSLLIHRGLGATVSCSNWLRSSLDSDHRGRCRRRRRRSNNHRLRCCSSSGGLLTRCRGRLGRTMVLLSGSRGRVGDGFLRGR